MGGSRVMPEAERLIVGLWNRLKEQGRDHSAAKVLTTAHSYVKVNNRKDILLPGLRKVQYILKDARKRENELSPKEKKMQKPWSMATLDEYSLPSESIPNVLQVWRYSVNLGAEFTIRQAKWASRLCYLLKDLDISEQWIQIMRYSREEELSLLSGTQMRTDQLNSLLIMEPWERMTLIETDVKFKANRNINHTFTAMASDGGLVEEFFYAFADIAQSHLDMDLDDKLVDNFDRSNELTHLIWSLPSSSKYFPDFESRMVYLRHLAKLSTLPYWKTAKPEEIHSLTIDLRAWIIARMKDKIEKENNPPKSLLGLGLHSYGGFPLDIYLRAGFSLKQDTQELEAELRKVHPDWFEYEGGKQ